MNTNSLFSKRPFDVRILYVAAALIVALGYTCMFRGYEDSIAMERADADAARAQTVSYEQKIAQRGAIDAEMRQLKRQLHNLELSADTSTTVAYFLRDVAGTAARQHVDVVGVESETPTGVPGPRSPSSLASPAPTPVATPASPQNERFRSGAVIAATGPASPAPAASSFDEVPLQLTLHGRYSDLLATARALAHMRVLARVDVVSLSRVKLVHPGTAPDLNATIQVTLYHFAQTSPRPRGLRDAAARPS